MKKRQVTLLRELDRRGWRTKCWQTRKGRTSGGRPFTRASLREASGGATHAEMLEREAAAQEWSLGQPEFLAGVQRIRAKIAGTA